jgi:hypothetical protein
LARRFTLRIPACIPARISAATPVDNFDVNEGLEGPVLWSQEPLNTGGRFADYRSILCRPHSAENL